jgi:hypothetical protein
MSISMSNRLAYKNYSYVYKLLIFNDNFFEFCLFFAKTHERSVVNSFGEGVYMLINLKIYAFK